MTDQLGKNSELREYLLGNINLESEMTKIEEKLMVAEEYFQELLIEEEELVQDYVDGDLTFDEVKKFEERFLSSEEGKNKVQFARALRQFLSESDPQVKSNDNLSIEEESFFDKIIKLFRQPVVIFASLLIVAIISIFVVWKFSNVSSGAEFIAALNKTYSKERPLESRISDLNYSSLAPKTRGKDDVIVDKNELKRAEMIARNSVSENPSAENYHHLGQFYLSVKNFDEALKQFETAIKLSPNDAKIHNDLGISWMEKANFELAKENSKSSEFRVKAKESFEKAIQLNKNLAEPYFNKALVLQSMDSSDLAKQAWEDYLKIDSTSNWADEARNSLQKIENKK